MSLISLTDKAAEHIKGLIEKQGNIHSGLRVFIEGGGCAGYQYGFDLAESAKDTEQVLEDKGITIYLDRKSALYLVGCEIDFESTMMFSGFKVNNPNASSSCGCGTSFSV